MSRLMPMSYVLLDEAMEGEVRVRRKNRDMFFMTLGEAVAVCADFAKDKNDFTAQVTDLLDALSEWVTQRRDGIKSAHLTFRPDRSVFFVVMQKETPFDAKLSEELTDLDINVANDPAFDRLKLDVLLIPAVSRDSANAFLSSGEVFTHA